MAANTQPGAIKRCARGAKPFNTALIATGIVLDGVVIAWACLDGQGLVDPAIYGAVSAVLKALNVAIHFLSKTTGSADDGEDSNSA